MRRDHHIDITAEMKMDLQTWETFLQHPSIYARKFIDLDTSVQSSDVDFYTDVSANPKLGCGGICGNDWYILQWDEEFIKKTPAKHKFPRIVCHGNSH